MKTVFISFAAIILSCGSSQTNEQKKEAVSTASVMSASGEDITDKDAPGTLTCLANGKPFTATTAAATIESVLSDGTLQIFGTGKTDAIEILMTDKEVKAGATIRIEGSISLNYANPDKLEAFATTLAMPGTAKIISRTATSVHGTFSFEAEDAAGTGKKVKVMEGKFNVKIDPQK